MKVSVSLVDRDLATLDAFATHHNLTRSAAVAAAIALLRESSLKDQYEAADAEWTNSGEAALWDATAGDGLKTDAPG